MLTQEVDDVLRLREVDEGIADIALVSEVDAEIAEVIFAEARLVDNLLELGSSHLVWDIAEHNRGADVLTCKNFAFINWIGVARGSSSFWWHHCLHQGAHGVRRWFRSRRTTTGGQVRLPRVGVAEVDCWWLTDIEAWWVEGPRSNAASTQNRRVQHVDSVRRGVVGRQPHSISREVDRVVADLAWCLHLRQWDVGTDGGNLNAKVS